jgi:hypothetical protein
VAVKLVLRTALWIACDPHGRPPQTRGNLVGLDLKGGPQLTQGVLPHSCMQATHNHTTHPHAQGLGDVLALLIPDADGHKRRLTIGVVASLDHGVDRDAQPGQWPGPPTVNNSRGSLRRSPTSAIWFSVATVLSLANQSAILAQGCDLPASHRPLASACSPAAILEESSSKAAPDAAAGLSAISMSGLLRRYRVASAAEGFAQRPGTSTPSGRGP